jgi:dihydroorotase
MAILLKSLRLINSSSILSPQDYIYTGSEIKPFLGQEADITESIDCSHLYGSLGWMDLRCMSGEPGEEYKESLDSLGNLLEASGFVKAVLLPNTHPTVQSKSEVEYIKAKSSGWLTELIIQGAVTKGAKGEDFTDILDLNHAGVHVFGDGLNPISNPDRLMKALLYLQKFNGTLFDFTYDPLLALFGQMHEGETSTRLGLKGIPNLAEEVAVYRNLEILRYTGGKIHFQTISTAGAVDRIRKAKSEGLEVTADVSIYQLLFSDKDLCTFDTHLKVMPPFRGDEDRLALLEGIKDGTIDALVSNHNPQDFDSKHMEFDLASFGMIGLQTFLPALVKLSEELPWPILISKVTTGPRKVLGYDSNVLASLTLFDPHQEWVYDQKANLSLSANSPWMGEKLLGKVVRVINGNAISNPS